MKTRTEIVLAGVGGQGLILIGKIIGEAAALYEGKNAVQTQSYGVASRGGFSKSELVISDEEIAYPEVMEPDLVLALSQQSYDMYRNKIGKNCLLIFDSDTVDSGECSGKAMGYPMTSAAVELHSLKNLNMIALGILSGLTTSRDIFITGFPSYDSIRKSLEQNSPSQYRHQNLEAFEHGFKLP
ncbi:MAG: 2-oxoacid:acceptor oxidoreductase family protein [Tepidanaerobacteraceae bacterium]|nr:2-oxoacid:acceptor oxidoreductase family protein [Tepidanaerobacteraceae bacterium]